MKNSILLLSCIFESTVSIHMHISFQKIMKCITHLCKHTSQTQNLWLWPKRPPLAFSVAETSVAECPGRNVLGRNVRGRNVRAPLKASLRRSSFLSIYFYSVYIERNTLCKPSILFMEHRQTVKTQVRRRLIRVSPFCLQKVLLILGGKTTQNP